MSVSISRGEQVVRRVVRENAIYFLRHLSIEAPETGLNMTELYVKLARGDGTREDRVRVTLHKHNVGILVEQDAFQVDNHLAGLFALRPRPDDHIVLRLGQLRLFEEHLVEVL